MTQERGRCLTRVVWINGAFGVGKTTAARVLAQSVPSAVVIDPEHVGMMLRASLQPVAPVRDFQDWRAWRTLVPATINAIIAELDGKNNLVIVPQTITNELYGSEIVAGLQPTITLATVALRVDKHMHRQRVLADTDDPGAAQWRIDKFAEFEAAAWVHSAFAGIDTTKMDPDEVVSHVERIIRETPL